MKLFVAVLIGLLALSGPAFAQPTDVKAMAEALFKDGRRLMDEENYDEACPKLEESYRLEEKLGTLLNMAICHDKIGKTASAWAEFTEVASQARQRNDADRAEYAAEQAKLLEPKLSRLTVQSDHPYDQVTITIDGKALTSLGTPLPLDPGPHDLMATADGKQPWTTTVTLLPGPASETVTVPTLADAPATPQPLAGSSDSDAAEGADGMLIGGIIIGGVGVIGLGIGSAFGILTFTKKSDAEDAGCPQDQPCTDDDGQELSDTAHTFADVSTGAFIAGAVLAVAGGIMIGVSLADDDEGDAEVTLVPQLTGAALIGRF